MVFERDRMVSVICYVAEDAGIMSLRSCPMSIRLALFVLSSSHIPGC
jgi:hypothetical protein